MNAKRAAIVGALALALTIGVTAMVAPSSAQQPVPPIAVELLTQRATFTDDIQLLFKLKRDHQVINVMDPSRTVVARITVQPGAQFPWHTHAGPVIVNVAQGMLVYVHADDCIERDYPTGTAFVDPGRGNVHTAFNPTDDVTVLLATFFEAPETGPLTITEGVEPPADCPIEVGAHGAH